MKKNDKLLSAYSQAPDKLQGSATGRATVDKMYMMTLSLYGVVYVVVIVVVVVLFAYEGKQTQKDIIK